MTTLEEMTLERFQAGQASVERTLLVVSGLETEEQVSSYQKKLDRLQEDVERYNYWTGKPSNSYGLAEALFDYFWEIKLYRYNGDFLLAKVIDNQLDKDRWKKVGNCVGLTSLYSVLGLRLGLDLSVLVNGDHVRTLLHCDNKGVVVENNDKDGFNFRLEYGYEEKDLIWLVTEVLFSRGYEKRDLGDLNGALADYNRAIELKPDLVLAKQNKERLLDSRPKPWYKKIFKR